LQAKVFKIDVIVPWAVLENIYLRVYVPKEVSPAGMLRPVKLKPEELKAVEPIKVVPQYKFTPVTSVLMLPVIETPKETDSSVRSEQMW
jgi:hypothetical protein